MSYNMPPGVSESDIPGNSPEDVAWEKLLEDIAGSGLSVSEARARWESQPAMLEAAKRAVLTMQNAGYFYKYGGPELSTAIVKAKAK